LNHSIAGKPGDIIRLLLPDGQQHTYARILIDDSYAFYDARTEIEIASLTEIKDLFIF
jgi:hypothetical protein